MTSKQVQNSKVDPDPFSEKKLYLLFPALKFEERWNSPSHSFT